MIAYYIFDRPDGTEGIGVIIREVATDDGRVLFDVFDFSDGSVVHNVNKESLIFIDYINDCDSKWLIDRMRESGVDVSLIRQESCTQGE